MFLTSTEVPSRRALGHPQEETSAEGLVRGWMDDLDEEIRSAGRSPEDVRHVRELLQRGVPSLEVVRPCTLSDGIRTLDERHEAIGWSVVGRTQAFIPASGAATRLFAPWRRAVREQDLSLAPAVDVAPAMPLYVDAGDPMSSLRATLDRWDAYPKALLPIHAAGRTLVDDHLDECDAMGVSDVHFTTSPRHRQAMEDAVAGRATLSTQEARTDTVIFHEDLRPVRDAMGMIVFRPSGHGALLPVLDAVARDLVLVKNIDNVVHPNHRDAVLRWRLRMLGQLAELHGEVVSVLQRGSSIAAQILLRSRFGISVAERDALQQLDRPLRVCGMVRDRGQPGGGPFWVAGSDGYVRPQIVEACQLDATDPDHRRARREATHFHPADMALAFLGPSGRWPLAPYVDPSQPLVLQRREQGQVVRSVEQPGLWNGCMAGWNTLFVELPEHVFQPIKSIGDVARPAHRSVAGGGHLG